MNFDKNNGITLMALVVTIIILVILAGVSISALSGENGILTKAKEAKEKVATSEVKGKIELAGQMALIEGKGNLTRGGLRTQLDKYFTDYEVTEASEAWVVTVNGVTVDVPKDSSKGINEWGFYFDEMYVTTVNQNGEGIKMGCVYHEDGSAETFVTNPDVSGGYLICTSNVPTNSINYRDMVSTLDISEDGLTMVDESQNLELKCNFVHLHGIHFNEEYIRIEKVEDDRGVIETKYIAILYENGRAALTMITISNGIESAPQITYLDGLTFDAHNYIVKKGNTVVATVSSDGNAIVMDGEPLIRK